MNAPAFRFSSLARPAVLLPLLSLSLALPGLLSARTWTDAASGRTMEGDLMGVEGAKARIKVKATGKVHLIDIDRLSPEDQAFIRSGATTGGSGAASAVSVTDWPQFRGPKQDNISPDTGLLKEWPAGGPKKLWTYSKAGLGYAGHIIVGGKLYTIGTEGTSLRAVCVNIEDGSEVWAKEIGTDSGEGYSTGWGGGPRGAPTFSDGHLYCLGPNGNLVCVKADTGEVVWTKHLKEDFSGVQGDWGYAESPLVDGDKVVVAPGGRESGMVAFDKKSGEVVWKSSLNAGKAEYATILAVEHGGKRQYVRLFEKFIVGVSADKGEELWRSDWPGATAVIPTPIFSDGELYVTSGYGVGCKLVKLGARAPEDVWQNKEMKNHHGGVVRVGDHVYGFSDGPGLMCQDWKTGKMVWNEKGRGLVKGSVHVADGMLYCLNEDEGNVTLVDVSPTGYKERGRFQLEPQSDQRSPRGKIWTHPVVIGGKLYLRDQEHISCYDVKG